MLSALSAEGVEHLLVGAYAMAVHGVPRATGDIDLWVRPSQANAERVFRALARYGAPIGALTLDDLAKPGTVIQIGVEPHRIDVLTAIDGVEFGDAWSRRTTTDIAGLTVPVIGREDLIRNKRSTGRARDQADADRLENLE
jgi:hypothetical protein